MGAMGMMGVMGMMENKGKDENDEKMRLYDNDCVKFAEENANNII